MLRQDKRLRAPPNTVTLAGSKFERIANSIVDFQLSPVTWYVEETKRFKDNRMLRLCLILGFTQSVAFYSAVVAQELKVVEPGINDKFVDPALDVSEWLGRFEIESREVYASRERVLDACGIKAGMSVADVGAGTGFYSRLFARSVGETGWVYAVDISPRFLEHINRKSQEDGVGNVTSVLCSDDSANLPPNSIDVAFICDTYHHFEHPESTLASIYRAVKPGGMLVLVDFERIPGVSREFILGHVRAGKDVFREEVVAAGFRFADEVNVPSFKENYLLRFHKDK